MTTQRNHSKGIIKKTFTAITVLAENVLIHLKKIIISILLGTVYLYSVVSTSKVFHQTIIISNKC